MLTLAVAAVQIAANKPIFPGECPIMTRRDPVHCIVPPHILMKLLESKDRKLRDIAISTMLTSTQLRTTRGLTGKMAVATTAGQKRRTIYDARNDEVMPGQLVRGEGSPPSGNTAVDEAYDGLGHTYDFYQNVFERNSLDGFGMRLDGVVHFGVQFNNAFWDGQRMVFGDGDDDLFTGFTRSLDVIAHELTHGVTDFSANLEYHKQSGALNESMSDVFGSLVKQWHLGQDAATADWLIGDDIFTPGIAGDALRSLKNPGHAYDNPVFGRDPQPAHMRDYKDLPDTRPGDWGGVHINSGIPNHAFYLLATSLGGNAWDAPGHIWYEALTNGTGRNAQFQDFADTTHTVAGRRYGTRSSEQQAVASAWAEVGIRISGGTSGSPVVQVKNPKDTCEELRRQVESLAKKVDAIMRQLRK